MVKYTLKQCSYFLSVVDEGGIAQASRTLNISQPAIAQALDKLEDIYGFQLFIRHHARGMELTSQGRSFLILARNLVQEANRMERDALSIAAHKKGKIRMACFHTIAPFYLSDLITSYMKQASYIEIEARETFQDEIVSHLLKGEVDLALTYDMGLAGSDLDWIVLTRLKPYILLPKEHPYSMQKSLPLGRLSGDNFILFDGPYSREYFKGILSHADINPQISFRSTTMESVRCAVASGLGFSLSAMRPQTRETYNGGEVVAIEIEDDVPALPLILAWRAGYPPSQMLQDFIDFTKSRF
ncbi:LysR family transcriptional regulator [Curvivirga aplysinae]|uniref:LysR family transcriptional regulator n=1 Tax=Curvivirga aplysinae TaxID=2529852 RepID=UPI0012BD3F4F|nr:LysR family transcriptional regulator [Curvivirga aplysinae]MTI11324.1 LysR family transcriptional regulator [Curvivirga aplysinae]